MNSKEWKVLKEYKKEGVVLYNKENPSHLNCIKSTAVLNFPADNVACFLGEQKYRKNYDPMFEFGKYIQVVGF